MSAPLLRVEGLTTWLAAGDAFVRAVDDVSFTIERGRTFALLGESGCGKSMTALSIARLLPDAGQVMGGSVWLDGQDLLALPETAMRDIRGRRIAMVFQEPAASLNPVMTVGAQIAEVIERHTNLRGAGTDARVRELLDAVGIPDAGARRNEYPFQLSGGMKQRVMIAIALACEPDLLIADEPTTALDVTIQAQVLDLLRSLQQRTGMAILLITHDLGVVAEMAHDVAVMYAGQIVETAPRERFFRAPSHPYTRKLFASVPGPRARNEGLAVLRGSVPALTADFRGCRFAERCEQAWDLCRTTDPGWTVLEAQQGVRCHLHAEGAKAGGREGRVAGRDDAAPRLAPAVPATGAAASPLLQVEDLKVHFPIRRGILQRTVGSVRAVDGVSLSIGTGRTLALVGESGCGKTTAGRGILQLVAPSGGSVRFAGQELAGLDRHRMRDLRRHVQIIFQDPYASLNPRMRVRDIVEEGMSALGIGADARDRENRVDALLAQVGLTPDMKLRYPHEFSGGQRQRIAIARALAVEPRLIVCDEPTSALDVSVQAQILTLLKDLQERLGLSYLFITHNMAVVEYLAHEVAVMYLGRIVEHGGVEEVMRAPRHPYTQALLSAVPGLDPDGRREVIRLEGDLPSPSNPPAGCHFHPRCPKAMPECREEYPRAQAISPTHTTHCLLYRGKPGN